MVFYFKQVKLLRNTILCVSFFHVMVDDSSINVSTQLHIITPPYSYNCYIPPSPYQTQFILRDTSGTGLTTATRTIVILLTNRGLLRELTLSLSELRAGNEGERETSIQLSREARRRGILPRHLLSKEEMLWSSYK